ncbi:MAG: hypothetical protein WCV43_05500 [Candidatus Caldatribacteriota bacterium]|nr:hypothetical protein [Atribacterota bacterium]MDI9596208.1 hypothetical protein [Atribacterota bacterium]
MITRNTFMGIILIVIGILWTLSNFNLINNQWILPFIGIIFFAVYLYRGGIQKRGTIGFLIAGCIIFMVGLFAAINESFYLGPFEGPLFFSFIGIAFLPVYAIHTRHFSDDNSSGQKWPLYTSLIIILFGLFVLITETANIPVMQRLYRILGPLVLILLGIFIMFRQRKK